ncbi:metal-dependent hydrolase [Romboutsia weinsteinii]|uniref:Metal-dependent hydrolase n=1 Tax=Romboutsia weinsteinii TaxID=2020949 RepID=A0A371J2N1_9FIRM|nr:metal-dependent hydrolase [Romboutsia weinsteinii]RDY26954.1 metal-dependent hydrolase [Romboutsia weinsteinii]
MTKETHTKGGYILALLAIPFIIDQFLDVDNIFYKIILLMIYIYFASVGSLSPDIDMKGSYISKRFPNIYKHFGKKFKHRGFTHSLLYTVILCFIFELVLKYTDNNVVFLAIASGFVIGHFSHICLDLITKEGVELFYPLGVNFTILPIKTSSKTEKFICKLLNFIVIFLFGYRFYLLI